MQHNLRHVDNLMKLLVAKIMCLIYFYLLNSLALDSLYFDLLLTRVSFKDILNRIAYVDL